MKPAPPKNTLYGTTQHLIAFVRASSTTRRNGVKNLKIQRYMKKGHRAVMTHDRLHPYAAYKDSGIVWLRNIPAHWVVTRLKSFATVQPSNVDKKSKEGEENVRLCNYVDVYYNEMIDKRIDFMSATATSEQVRRFSLQSGDVLITKDSETWTDIAVPAVVSEDLPGVLCGYHLAHIRPGQHCNGGFLSRLFAAIGPRDQYHISANGITRFGLTGDSIRVGVFALPPVPEQRAIAAFLDRETARIDTLVEKKERLIELLQEKRSALISHAVTRGLDPDVPTKDSGIEWLGEIPVHWEVKRLRMLANIATGGRDTVDQREDGQYPLFVRSQTVERIDTWSFDGEAILTAGDGVGVAKVFHYVNGKFDFHQRVYRFSNFRLVTGRFFFYYFMAMLRFEVLQGTSQVDGRFVASSDVAKLPGRRIRSDGTNLHSRLPTTARRPKSMLLSRRSEKLSTA